MAMTQKEILELLAEAPVIAAVKDEAGLAQSLQSCAKVIFTLYGSVLQIPDIVHTIRAAGKAAIVHLDLVDGLAPREGAVDFLAHSTQAQGIISTKQALVRRAKEQGLLAIRRFFLLDSMALEALHKQLAPGGADLVEVLPGTMPKTLRRLVPQLSLPVIAGGLIADKEDVTSALSAGAVAVSSTNPAVWCL